MDIRSKFLDFFASKNHTIAPSSSLIPSNDPTLLFTSAGMVQFKDIFTGKETRPYTRAATSQKCLRAGGKHNDLDNVGYTARHHTFFEMLGNFSFGDYFKEEAITYAFEFLTKELQLSQEKLWITVFAEDEETYTLWQKFFPKDRIIKINTSDNFWSMGDTGPCGPCTEIFYDFGPSIPGGLPGTPEQDGDRYMEIWNLVLMQYEQTPQGKLILPKPSIDTGMGLERITTVLEGRTNNYDTSLFKDIIAVSKDLLRSDHIQGHRVIADHIRATSFLIADGITPSNEGRGYVLRRIARRAIRHMYQMGAKEPMFHKMVAPLVQTMHKAYPELLENQTFIENTIKLEEERFYQTLSHGLSILETERQKSSILSGETAFKLYDTYGFPLDLTEDILKEHNQSVDKENYEKCMAEQRARSRASWAGSGEEAHQKIWFDLAEQFGPTEFIGYIHQETEAQILAIVDDTILTNQTPFYAESGGQMGDHGFIENDKGLFQVLDTQKEAGLHLHKGTFIRGPFDIGDAVSMRIDRKRRFELANNHSATHLLHAALKHVLGNNVVQKGSLVAADRLRFDFNYPKALTACELRDVQDFVNDRIQRAIPVLTEILSQDIAREKGAMSLFGEKYGDIVRVVSMDISIEFCGGTHVKNTGQIGVFKIASESSIGSGIRRVEAITGRYVLNAYDESLETIKEQKNTLLETAKRYEKTISDLKVKMLKIGSGTLQNGRMIYHAHLDNVDPKDLRTATTLNLQNIESGIVLCSTVLDGKVMCIVGVKNVADDASQLAQKIATILGGNGGGKKDMAQAGGPETQNIGNLVETLS